MVFTTLIQKIYFYISCRWFLEIWKIKNVYFYFYRKVQSGSRDMKFTIPWIWRNPTDNSSNCSFCILEPSKHRAVKKALSFVYPDLLLSITPMRHCPKLPVLTSPNWEQQSLEENIISAKDEVIDTDYKDVAVERNLYCPKQKTLTTWSEILLSQCLMPLFWRRDVNSGFC